MALDRDKTMVIACDSCGGIGLKAGDALQVTPFITGKYAARVAIMEVICAGAEVICLTNTICNEFDPTGIAIIQGIEEELKAAGIREVVLTGSTEENFSTVMTGLGITAVGLAETKKLKINNIKGEALLVALGRPNVGREVLNRPEEQVNYHTIRQLLGDEAVYELIPVGSQGILYEMQELARNNRLQLKVYEQPGININKSAGPSTVVIAAVSDAYFRKGMINGPMTLLGELTLGGSGRR
ncbi:hypothetical protein SPTER_35850 [Sporomusa termitida]|uniref:PurM-like N-terminal domain-containing protein n=1 Tax=Sporomusa termitida TaxID=2377 RepID=A0A517DXS6_9FIRM|nr:hypothetical protein SPTER_35850 [Sporomusa termitida]